MKYWLFGVNYNLQRLPIGYEIKSGMETGSWNLA
jgi:hypothetical protein